MRVHLVDGTYELFRYHFALPSHVTAGGREVAATRGVLRLVLGCWRTAPRTSASPPTTSSSPSATTSGRATRRRRDAARAAAQFPLLEDALAAAGFTVFPMVEFEADDALGAAAVVAAADPEVEQVLICTPDKDLGQCVGGDRIVQFDRRKGVIDDARASRRSSAWRRRRSPTTWRSSATAPTASRASRVGRQVGGHRAGPLRPPRGHPPPRRRLGRDRAQRCQVGAHACTTTSTWPCCSGASPPSRPTRPRSATWTSCAGVARARSSPRSPSSSRPPAS